LRLLSQMTMFWSQVQTFLPNKQNTITN
jgi:hypothetical protein